MNKIVTNILSGIFLIFFQTMFLNHVNFLNFLNPYLYIFLIIYFPLKTNRSIFILTAFFIGLAIDFFSDTHGIHAAACLCIAYYRTYYLKTLRIQTKFFLFNNYDFYPSLNFIFFRGF